MASRRKSTTMLPCPWREGGEQGGEQRGEEGGCTLQLLQTLQTDGVFSKTYICEDTASKRKYLAKKVYLKKLDQEDRRYRLNEAKIWTKLHHPNVLTCFKCWQAGPELWLLCEEAQCSVKDLVLDKGQPPPQDLFVQWLHQLASALQYLHEDQEKPILHRNVKPDNVMVVPHYIVKLADFGFSKQLDHSQAMTRAQVGTAVIMSPEIITNTPYNAKTDMWSLGITAVYIATLQYAVRARTFDTLFEKTREGQVKGIAGRYDQVIQDTVHSLLQVDPAQRPTASALLTHLKLHYSHCHQPPTAHSYPHRGTVQQARSTGECDTRSTSAQTTPSLYHADPTPQPDRCPGRTNVKQFQSTREQVSTSAQTTPSLYRPDPMPQPSVESLSVVLVRIVDRKNSAKDNGGPDQPRVQWSPRPRSQSSLESVVPCRPARISLEEPRPQQVDARDVQPSLSSFALGHDRLQNSEEANRASDPLSSPQPTVDDEEEEGRETPETGLSSNPLLINTFPGAFNVERRFPQGRLPPLQVPRRRLRSEADMEALTVSQPDRKTASGQPVRGGESPVGTSFLSEALVEKWPAPLRDYWNLSKKLLTKLSPSDFYTVMRLAKCFSKKEVQAWLEERRVEAAEECVEDIWALSALDDQLDSKDVQTCHRTLMGDSPDRHGSA